ncbi:MAG: hypothetical protein NTU43_07425 [Bacteroidetes bacterium]|nr:hypothetical protein [Bacteroidota bacterium]
MKVSDEFMNLLFDEIFVVKEKQNSVQFNYYGNNTARVLHIVDFEMLGTESKDEQAQLRTIIEKGFLLNADDNAIVFVDNIGLHDYDDIMGFFNPQKLIVWGCNDFASKQLKIKDYEIQQKGNTLILKVEPVFEYITSNAKKQQLWLQIKRMNTLA